MTTEMEVTDAEIEALMMELETESEKIVSGRKEGVKVESEPAPTPAVAVEEPEPEPEQELKVEEKPTVKPRPIAKPRPPFVPVADPSPTNEAPYDSIEAGADMSSDDIPMTSEKAKMTSLRHYIDPAKFKEDTRVTEATLDQCMIEQNGLRAYYGTLAAQAEAQASRFEARFKVIEAQLYQKTRETIAASGEKATEKLVENMVLTNPLWLKGKNAVIEAQAIADINKQAVESLKDRRDMIIQLGADRRDEYKGAARVLEERESREDLARRAAAAAKGKAAA